ncbi:MAG: sulfatase-like hydrolase/transferase, partial [Anaerolineales bacterium]
IRFDQAISGGSWTQAAFPVLMTSTYASMFGGCLGPLHPGRPSPVEALAAQGYATAGFSTSPLLSREYAYDRGFDHFVDLIPGEKDPWLRRIKGGQRLLRSPLIQGIADRFGRPMRPTRVYCSAEDVIDQVEAWLSSVTSPFFLWAHFMDTHWPYHLEEELREPHEVAQAWTDLATMHKANWRGNRIPEGLRKRFIPLYERSLAHVDGRVGRMCPILDEAGLSSNTVVIIVSDHGEEFLDHGRWGHWENNLCDEILRVPMIITSPNLRRAQIARDQVSTLAIMPTVLQFAGCPPPEGMLGTPIDLERLDDQASSSPAPAISEMWRDEWHRVSVRTKEFKLLWDSQTPDQLELFDLRAGPDEKRDVSRDHPNVVRVLKEYLESHLERVKRTRSSGPAAEPFLEQETVERLRSLGYIE